MPIEIKSGQPIPYPVPVHKVHHGPYTEAKLARAEKYLAAEEEPRFVGEVVAQCMGKRETPVSEREHTFVGAVMDWSRRYLTAALGCARRGTERVRLKRPNGALDLVWWNPLLGFGAEALLARLTAVTDAGLSELEQRLFVMRRIRELQYGKD